MSTPTQINEVIENKPYDIARKLLQRYDPNNPQLKTTFARSHSQQDQTRISSGTQIQDTEIRQRWQQQDQHAKPMQRPAVTVPTQVNGAQSPPVSMLSLSDSLTNLKESPDLNKGPLMQEQVGVASSQQFIAQGNDIIKFQVTPRKIHKLWVLITYYL